MTQFRFDREAHAYYLGAERIPGVTAVLSQVVDFSFVSDEVLARKCEIGSALHLAIELDQAHELDEESIDPAVVPYFDAWRKFKHEHRAWQVWASEKPVYSRLYRYGCTPDLWGLMEDGSASLTPFVTEIKSSASVHPAVALQTAAQLTAIAERQAPSSPSVAHRMIRNARRFALQLRPNGTYKLQEFTQRDDFAQFLALLSTYRWKQRNNLNR